MKCSTCGVNDAIQDPTYGVLECESCQESESRPKRQAEVTTDEIREQRKHYAADILMPYRDGVLSQEYLDTYGTLGIKPTKEQLKNAQNVWSDIPNIENVAKTKADDRKKEITEANK